MSIISQFFYAVLTTSFTGMLAIGAYKLSERHRFEWNPEFGYRMLRLSCLLYLVPVGYILLQLTVRDGYLQTDEVWQINFSFAGLLWIPGVIVGSVWVTLIVRCMADGLRRYLRRHRLFRGNVPVEDETAREVFLRVKEKLGIRYVRLYQNEGIDRPVSRGVFFRSVVLPDRVYTREQLSVIFHHELMHADSHDVFYKLCGACITTVQHLNPLTGDLAEQLNEWSEYYCDMRAIRAISDEMDAGRYFELIMDSVKDVPDLTDENYIFSMLCESQLRLERRIEYMKKYKNQKRVIRGGAVAFSFAFVMLGVTTTYAAGSAMAGFHDYLYRNAEMTAGESDKSEELKEFYLPASEDDSYRELVYANPELELICPLLESEEMVQFDWTVSPDVRHVSKKFDVEAGQSISISCSTLPANVLYWIGIQDEWNNVRFVQGYNSLAHEFEIKNGGSYRVLVQNRGKVTITSSGSYYFFTPEETTEPEPIP